MRLSPEAEHGALLRRTVTMMYALYMSDRQFAKGNATLFEWSGSPIVYRIGEEWARIEEVSKQYFSEKAAVYHYYGTASSTLQGYLLGDTVRYKNIFMR